MSEVPEGLHNTQYSIHLLQEILGWPAKGNIELMADCLTAIQKAKRLNEVQAYKYMVRAIHLAKEQGVKVDRLWLMGGEYMNVRPIKESRNEYMPIDWKAVKEHQNSPEFNAAWEELRQKCAKAFGVPVERRRK